MTVCVRVFAGLMPQFMLNTLDIYSDRESFAVSPFSGIMDETFQDTHLNCRILFNTVRMSVCVCLSLPLGRLSGINNSRTCKHACSPFKWCMIYLSSMVENEINFFSSLFFCLFFCCCRPCLSYIHRSL